jgi:A/G-specific adenine glycosylase
MVSEVMLQQTQVSRVIEKYKEFLKAFPNVRALAKAPLSNVLKVWSGMGYNRRAKYLLDAAKIIVEKHRGKIPSLYSELVELPGIGNYTASAIRVFAFNEPDVLIETNVRSVYLHHFFKNRKRVSDQEISVITEKVLKGNPPAGGPREWHWALMDYGAHLKRLHKNPARKSAHYAKQSKFEGSLRQVRGAILRELLKGATTQQSIYFLIRANKKVDKKKIVAAFSALARDGLITKQKRKWGIA